MSLYCALSLSFEAIAPASNLFAFGPSENDAKVIAEASCNDEVICKVTERSFWISVLPDETFQTECKYRSYCYCCIKACRGLGFSGANLISFTLLLLYMCGGPRGLVFTDGYVQMRSLHHSGLGCIFTQEIPKLIITLTNKATRTRIKQVTDSVWPHVMFKITLTMKNLETLKPGGF